MTSRPAARRLPILDRGPRPVASGLPRVSAPFLHRFCLTFCSVLFTIPPCQPLAVHPRPQRRNSAPYQYSWQTGWLPPVAKARLPFPRATDPPSLKATASARFRISAFGFPSDFGLRISAFGLQGSGPWMPPTPPPARSIKPNQTQSNPIKPNQGEKNILRDGVRGRIRTPPPNRNLPARSAAPSCPGGAADNSPGQGPPERSAGGAAALGTGQR
jgi:hypothetical protein